MSLLPPDDPIRQLLTTVLGLPPATPGQPQHPALAVIAETYAPRTMREAGLATQAAALQTTLLHACSMTQRPDLTPNQAIRLHRSAVTLSKELRATTQELDRHQARAAEASAPAQHRAPAALAEATPLGPADPESAPPRQNPMHLNATQPAAPPPSAPPHTDPAPPRQNPMHLNATQPAAPPPSAPAHTDPAPPRQNPMHLNATHRAATPASAPPHTEPAPPRHDPMHLNAAHPAAPPPSAAPHPPAERPRHNPMHQNAEPHPLAHNHRVYSGDALARFTSRRLTAGEDAFAVWEAATRAEAAAEAATPSP